MFLTYRLLSTKQHVVGSKVETQVERTFDTAFHKTLNVIGDMCERTCCDKVLLYIVNTFP